MCIRLLGNIVYFQSLFLLCITLIHVTTILVTSTFVPKEQLSAESNRDYDALLAFKSDIIHDPFHVLNSWNNSRHFCEWEGVICGRRHKRVTDLILNSKGLSGTLSPHIGNLSFLKRIVLENNSFSGEIPGDFGRLFRLKVLALSQNIIGGKIPANLSHCSKLRALFLGDNNLIGNIPTEFVTLSNLKALFIFSNKLIGGIPPFLGNLTSLEYISTRMNALGGNIPDSLGRLKNLRTLIISENNLSGIIPPSIYNLSLLSNFSLPDNQLHGSLPSNLGLALPNLEYFQIRNNSFSGTIPLSLSNASKLSIVELYNNTFYGKISVDFGGMQNLVHLNLGLNNLGNGESDEMNFIETLSNCSKLKTLVFSFNNLRGKLPNTIGNLSNQVLQRIYMESNQLYGGIPADIGNLAHLNFLYMQQNMFTGKIPKEIGRLTNLQILVLGDNNFLGEIPSSLGNLSSLGELYLYNNRLSGRIPSSLGNLKGLSFLELQLNNLSGAIPKEVFDLKYLSRSLNLSQNHFSGPLPPNIGNLDSLGSLDVSNNNFSGEIPSDLNRCSSLERLYMGGNSFNGSIPSSLGFLKGIRVIDFSRNNLSGEIPKFLERLSLEYLNLSFNAFNGEVPTKGIFANASAISLFGNTKQLCGGIPELHLPKCVQNHSRKESISLVLKVLISIITFLLILILVSILAFCWLKKRKKEKSFGSMLRESFPKVSYKSILEATNGFSSDNLIGSGSFGSVYKGTVVEEAETITVAIKVLNLQRQGACKSFVAECKALRNVRHRNLVKVITACSSIDFQGNEFKAIVYEYMQNGSLDKWLHPPESGMEGHTETRQRLTLLQRIIIAIDVASALDYFHNHCHNIVLYCDLKPSNVLLDSDITGKIGDFGLVKFLSEPTDTNQSSSVGIRGTIGYAAPEYGLGAEVSANGDIYSYGILLLEMITGKKPTDGIFEGAFNLHDFARTALPDRVMEIVDPMLLLDDDDDDEELGTDNNNHRLRQARNDNKNKCLISMVRIGVYCSMESSHDRMNINDAIRELQSIKKILQESLIGLNRQKGQRS